MRFGIWLLLASFFLPRGFAADPAVKIGAVPASRILFLGNSITKHGPAPQIGWEGDWGMAASSADKDYVHLVTAAIERDAGARPKILVKNIADFERKHAGYDYAKELAAELAFKPEIVFVAIGENVPEPKTDEAKQAYATAYAALLAELRKNSAPLIITRGSFWPNAVKDELMRQASKDAGVTFVELNEIGRDAKNAASAERDFKHAGVAGHPGDRGMQAIADALVAALKSQSKTIGR